MFAGHVILGFCVSLTVTVNWHCAILLDVSVAAQVTVVTPFGKAKPDAGVQITLLTPGQLSVAAGVTNVATAVQRLVSVLFTMFAGQVKEGSVTSLTVTVKEQEPRLPAASATEQVTVVTPFWKVEPLAGTQVTMPTPVQLSLAVGVV